MSKTKKNVVWRTIRAFYATDQETGCRTGAHTDTTISRESFIII